MITERWAVTGAAGFIGRTLLERLAAGGQLSRGLVRRSGPKEMVHGSLADRAALRELVADAGVVVHLAAYVHRRAASQRERAECRETNVDGTRALVDAIADVSPDAFLIFVSTSGVYPALAHPADEQTPPQPRTYYGQTKLEAEILVRHAVETERIRATILRPSMVFGPSSAQNLGRLVATVRRRVVPVVGSDENRKSLLPVETLIDAITGVADHRAECHGQVFNVAGATLTMRRLTDVIAQALAVRVVRVRLPARLAIACAGGVDAVTARIPARLPSVRQMVDTYASSAAIDDNRLRQLIPLAGTPEVEAALRRTVVALAGARRVSRALPRAGSGEGT